MHFIASNTCHIRGEAVTCCWVHPLKCKVEHRQHHFFHLHVNQRNWQQPLLSVIICYWSFSQQSHLSRFGTWSWCKLKRLLTLKPQSHASAPKLIWTYLSIYHFYFHWRWIWLLIPWEAYIGEGQWNKRSVCVGSGGCEYLQFLTASNNTQKKRA